MDVLAFGAGAYTYLEGMVTRNTTDLKTYLAYSADYEKITVDIAPAQTQEEQPKERLE